MSQAKHYEVPLSGQILGAVVRELQLHNDVLAGKTAQRYFSGLRVKDDSKQEIFEAIGEALVDHGIIPTSPFLEREGFPLARVISMGIAWYADQWDRLVGYMRSTSAPVDRPDLAATSYLRLAMIDQVHPPGDNLRYGGVPGKEAFAQNWSVEKAGKIIFEDSDTDLVMAQTVTLFDFWKDGLSSVESQYELHKAFPDRATDIDVNEAWLSSADVRDYHDIRRSIVEFAPHAIVNLSAITDMEECERNPEDAWLTNTLGAENVALVAGEFDVPHIYISTAGIFGGENEFFDDFDTPNPLSVYAKSKYAGEMFVKQHLRKHYVVRAGWMMGGGPRKDKKFVNKIYKQLLQGKRELSVVDDKLGTPTYTVDFANGLLTMLKSDLYGVYNQVCPGSCSRYDVAVLQQSRTTANRGRWRCSEKP